MQAYADISHPSLPALHALLVAFRTPDSSMCICSPTWAAGTHPEQCLPQCQVQALSIWTNPKSHHWQVQACEESAATQCKLALMTSKGPVQTGPRQAAEKPEPIDCRGLSCMPSPSCLPHNSLHIDTSHVSSAYRKVRKNNVVDCSNCRMFQGAFCQITLRCALAPLVHNPWVTTNFGGRAFMLC